MAKVVVVGAGQGGLSAAIHARLKGHDVTVLEQHASFGGKATRVEDQAFRFDPGPSIVILPQLYESVFQRAGRRMEDYLRFERLDPFSRIYFEGQDPIDLPSEESALLQVLAEVAPTDVSSIRSILASLDRVSDCIDRTIFDHAIDRPWQLVNKDLIRFAMAFDVRKSYRQMVDEWFRSPMLRAFYYGFPNYSGQTYDSKSASGLLIPYYMIRGGVWWPVGGISAIPAAFYRLAVDLGVQFEFGQRVKGFRVDGKTVSSVGTSQGEVECDHVISNADRLTAAAWLDRQVDVRPSYSYFTLHWGIRKQLDQLSHHTLFVPKNFEQGFADLYGLRRFPNPPIVYVNSCVKLEPEVAPAGCTDVFAVVTCPALESHLDWPSLQDEAEAGVLRQLNAFGVSWEPNEVVVKRRQTPMTFQERDGSYRGSLYGPDEPARMFGGILPLSVRDPEYANVSYSGGSVQPGAGLPMVTLSGRFAADCIR